MQRKISSIRDMSIVEKELSQSEFGVIAISTVKEKSFIQFAANYVYQDKNVYVYIDDKELLRNIRYDSLVRFTIYKSKKTAKAANPELNPLYQLFSVNITGKIREVEEKKTIKDVTQSFIEKYSGKLMVSGQAPELKGKLLFVDTEEFLAFDEIGF